MHRPWSVFSVIFALLFACSITALAGGLDGSLQIKGSDTMVNLAQAWAEEFMKIHPESSIAVTGGGSGTGIAGLINGTCDVACSSRKITEKEIALMKKKGLEPMEHVLALDGIAVVVHPSNPVSQLTIDQLRDIFTGKITNWNQVGGKSAQIVILSREVNSGTHVFFKEHVLVKEGKKERAEFAPSALLLSSSQAIADEITQNPDAIGYYGMGYVSAQQKAIAVGKSPEGPFEKPSPDAVRTSAYPIARPLFIYTTPKDNALVNEFLQFAESSQGQKIVLEIDFVPVH